MKNFLHYATKWELVRVAGMLLFDDYQKEYTITGFHSTLVEPSRLQLMYMVLARQCDKITLHKDTSGMSLDAMFSIVLNNEFVVEYMFPNVS